MLTSSAYSASSSLSCFQNSGFFFFRLFPWSFAKKNWTVHTFNIKTVQNHSMYSETHLNVLVQSGCAYRLALKAHRRKFRIYPSTISILLSVVYSFNINFTRTAYVFKHPFWAFTVTVGSATNALVMDSTSVVRMSLKKRSSAPS